MKLIDKSAVMAEIDRRIKVLQKHPKENHKTICHLDSLKQFLNTFEMKDVDLEKEIQQHINDCLDIKFPTTDIKLIKKDVAYTARKFFELGLKAQKGENAKNERYVVGVTGKFTTTTK